MKKLVAILLVVAMCLMLLAACAKAPTTDEPQSGNQTTETPAADNNEPTDDGEEPEDEGEEEDEEMAEITMCYFDVFANGEKADHVNEAINEIMEAEYNLHIDISWWAIGDYMTQLSLAASAGQLPDIIGGFPMLSAASMQASGQLMDIAPYLNSKDAEGVMSVVGDYLGAFTIDGGIYGVPSYRIYTTQYYIIMRGDVLEEIGMTDFAKNMTTWAQYDELLEAVDNAYDDLYPVSKGTGKGVIANQDVQWTSMLTGGPFSEYYLTDKLGDVTLAISTTPEGETVALSSLETYRDACKKAADWYEKGWLYPDGAFSDDHCDTLMKQGVQFSDFQPSEVGIESAKKSATGYDIVATQINNAMVKTSDLNTWGLGLSTSCTDPEGALRFISAYYTDERIENLMTWGVEGVDYVVNENGEATFGDLDNTTAYHSGDWIHGNQFLALPWEGQGGDFRAVSKAINDAATNSPFLGFAVNLEGLDGVVASVTAVNNEYLGQIAGGYYTDALYAEMEAKYEAAGIQEYIDCYQAQLNDWLAAQ